MIHVGFTGTRNGLTFAQAFGLEGLLDRLPSFRGHHGDCVGADADFDRMARRARGFVAMTIHPSTIADLRAFCARPPYDDLRAPLPPLDRDDVMVAEIGALIAAPKEPYMIPRSGTWATARRAKKRAVPIAIVLPDGVVAYEGTWPFGVR